MIKYLAIFVLSMFLAGCIGGGSSAPNPRLPSPPSGKLFQFTDAYLSKLKNRQNIRAENCDIGRCYKLQFIPNGHGSTGIGGNFTLPKSYNLTLKYMILMESDFECTAGGKAMGFRTKNAPTAGAGKPAIGKASARVMWTKHCYFDTYVYDREIEGPYGDHGPIVNKIKINDGKWHKIELKVSVGNYVRIYVDGVLSSEHIPFDTNAPIEKFLMTWFHGGNTANYTPTKPQFLYIAQIEVR